MNFNRKSGAVLFISIMVALTLVTGGALAALTYDTTSDGTTETESTSDWSQDTTVTDLDNSSKVSAVEVQSDNATNGDNFVLRAIVNNTDHPQDNQTVYETTQSWTATNSTSGNYEVNLTHGDVFDGLEREAGENVTLDVETVWNETETDEESALIQIHAQNGDDPTLVADNRTTLMDTAGITSKLAFWSEDESVDAAKYEKTVGVNSNTTTLTIGEGDSNVSDAMSESVANTEAGDLTTDAYVKVNGHFVPVYDSNAQDVEYLNTSQDAYAVAESGQFTVHNVNDTYDDNTTSVDVVAAANADLAFRDQYGMLRDYGADRRDAFSAAWGAGIGATDFSEA